jgi:hypothetical protein
MALAMKRYTSFSWPSLLKHLTHKRTLLEDLKVFLRMDIEIACDLSPPIA